MWLEDRLKEVMEEELGMVAVTIEEAMAREGQSLPVRSVINIMQPLIARIASMRTMCNRLLHQMKQNQLHKIKVLTILRILLSNHARAYVITQSQGYHHATQEFQVPAIQTISFGSQTREPHITSVLIQITCPNPLLTLVLSVFKWGMVKVYALNLSVLLMLFPPHDHMSHWH